MTQKSCAVGMRNAILRNHLNREGTFGNQEGMITDVFLDADWQSTPAFKLVPLLKRILKRYFRNASLLSIILSFNTFGVEYM